MAHKTAVAQTPAMEVKRLASNTCVHTGVVICICFLFTSTGWLSWMYRLMELDPSLPINLVSMVFGYLMQALGVGAYLLGCRQMDLRKQCRLAVALLALYALLLVPSILLGSVAVTLLAGFVANVVCGAIQGFYVYLLAHQVEAQRQGSVFGCAYAASTLLTWLLSLPAEGAFTQGAPCLVLCGLMAVVAMALVWGAPATRQGAVDSFEERAPASLGQLAPLAAFAVVMASLVKTVGFSFPTEDLAQGISLELSRLIYGVGLVAAGVASDRDRRLGLLSCAVALVAPFLMLALSGANAPSALLWALGYLLTGFFAVFRVLLTVDLACEAERPQLAATGLLLGRVGDALGCALCLALEQAPVALVSLAFGLFVLTMGLFFGLYQQMYGQALPASQDAASPEAALQPSPAVAFQPPRTERERFEDFAAAHELTARERDVLRLLLVERSNSEIAGELGITEKTVKYHVGNLLKKTSCKNRLEILALYAHA